jgi:hypothetical protein
MSLAYKYCDEHGVSILENLELKISPPNQFNDPFEFTPQMFCPDLVARATYIVETEPLLKQMYDNLRTFGRFHGPYEAFLAQVRTNREKFITEIAKLIMPAAAITRDNLLDRVSALNGVLCLSKRWDSILMWGHYCKKHQGVVIGFDTSHPIFAHLQPVDYDLERVAYNASWIAGDLGLAAFEKKIVFSKNKDWDYEEELRQIISLQFLKKKPLANGEDGYFLAIPPEIVRTVILGAKCSKTIADKIRSVLSQSHFANVKLEKVALHESKYQLTFG